MSKPKLALIPSGYKSGKVYSILPNDATGDFDYERNGNATRVRKDGLIEELTVDDTPRLDWYNSNCPSLLLEPQRTNLHTYSESSTSKTTQNVTLTDNSETSPDGEFNAIKVTDNTVNFRHRFWANNVSVTSGTQYTISFYVKKNSPNRYIYINAGILGTNGSFSLDDQSTTGSVQVFETLNNEWYRIGLTGTAPTTQTTIWFLQMQLGTTDANYIGDGSSFYVWGLQFEQGSYPTSYIKTEASTVTRLKDDLQDLNNVDLINSVEGVFYAEIRAFKSETVFRFITLNDGTSSNTVRIYLYNRIYSRLLVGGVEQCIFNTTDYDVTEFNKIAFLYSPNNFKLFVNGVLIGTDTSGSTFTNGTLTTLSFDRGDNAFRFDGAVKDLRVYDTTLTDNQLIELTK